MYIFGRGSVTGQQLTCKTVTSLTLQQTSLFRVQDLRKPGTKTTSPSESRRSLSSSLSFQHLQNLQCFLTHRDVQSADDCLDGGRYGDDCAIDRDMCTWLKITEVETAQLAVREYAFQKVVQDMCPSHLSGSMSIRSLMTLGPSFA